MSLLTDLIEEQFKIVGRGRWLSTQEHDSLVIDTEKDIFFWNSKRISGDAYVWLTKIVGLPKQEALKYIRTGVTPYTPTVTIQVGNSTQKIIPHEKLVNLFWEVGKNHRDYWYARGITDSTCDRFRLGYDEGWYLIPFFYKNHFVNFQKRRDTPEKRICSWYTGTHPYLFNSDILRIATAVIITESPTDAILLSQYGYPAVSHNGGAGYWSKDWNKEFVNQKELYIVYDNDEAGIKGAQVIAENLGIYRSKVYNFTEFPHKYDMGDWLKEHEPSSFGELLDDKARRIFE